MKKPPTTLYFYIDVWGKHYYLSQEQHVRYRVKDDTRWVDRYKDDPLQERINSRPGPRVWRLTTPGDWEELNWEDYK